MATGKSREDEVYEEGVQDGQKSRFVDSVIDLTTKEVSLWDPRLFEIYKKGYEYGQSNRPAPPADIAHPEAPAERWEPSSESTSSESSGTGCGVLFAILAGGAILVIAILWFVFALAIPLLVIDIAALALIASLIRKPLSKFLLPVSIAGAVLAVADYNQGWFTKALAANVPFLAGMIPVLFYINVLAGLIAAYLLIRALMDKRNPPPEDAGEFTKRNLITMGCLVLVGALAVGIQVRVDSQRKLARLSTMPVIPKSGNISLVNPGDHREVALDHTGAKATQSAATSEATLAPFVGDWNKEGGGYIRVVISGSSEKPRVHMWASCMPQNCDNGEEDGIWDGSTLTTTFQRGRNITVFRLTLDQSSNLKLNCHSSGDYNGDCMTMTGYTRTPLDMGGDDTPQTPR